jgi:K+-transporting ATPase ATPase C chain
MKLLTKCFRLFLVLMILTGIVYPLMVTLVAQLAFHAQAEGSLISVGGKITGSALLAQKTVNPKYFWPRPSADDYGTIPSGASNLGPSSAALKKAIGDFAAGIRSADRLAADAPVPDDLITTSASGLDPHISPQAARLQIGRVADARGLSAEQRARLSSLVESHVEGPQLGFLGNARVNVFLLNLDLDKL